MATQTGYKASELGMIPLDWEVVELGSIGEPIIGLTYSPRDINDNGILVLRSSNIHSNKLIFDNNVFVKMEIPERVIVKENDILICVRNGSRQLIGKCALITKEAEGFAFGAFMSVFRTLFAPFVFYAFQSDKIQNQIKEIMGATINQITNKDLREFKIAIPKSITEQTAIATALSDTDALISSLQTLITKKQAIKLSAMQNLLSGKIRLPEFAQRPDGSPKTTRQTELGCVPEDWAVVELGDVGKTYGGLSGKNKSDFDRGDSFYVPFTNVMANLEVDKNQLGKVEVNEKQNAVLEGDLLFNGSSETPEEVCFASFVNFSLPNLFLNSFCFGFRLTKNTISPKYLAYWFRSEIGRKTIAFMSQGSTRYNISKSEFVKLKLVMPSKPEQTAIAQLLSDMDAEIESLEGRLKKTQSLKQGMMQALLTGKIRLPLE